MPGKLSGTRIAYDRQARTVTFYPKANKGTQPAPPITRPALDWLTDLTVHIHNSCPRRRNVLSSRVEESEPKSETMPGISAASSAVLHD